jgi:hypothetical protein
MDLAAAKIPGATESWSLATTDAIRSWEVGQGVAKQLGILDAYNASWRGTSEDHKARTRFDGRAMRAMGKLVAEGKLVKVGRGERSPAGHVLGNEAEFYTPDAHAAAVAKHEAEVAAAGALQRRWELVYDHLANAGYQPIPVPNVTLDRARGKAVYLGIDGIEHLLGDIATILPRVEQQITLDRAEKDAMLRLKGLV